MQWIAVFLTGFFLYGPQMLIGLCGAEVIGRNSVGASKGFLGWVRPWRRIANYRSH